MKGEVKLWVEKRLGEERRIIQARFDELKLRITRQLEGTQSLNLEGYNLC